MDYIRRYDISPEKLRQQLVNPDFVGTDPDRFEDWLFSRAEQLAEEGNCFLKELKADL